MTQPTIHRYNNGVKYGKNFYHKHQHKPVFINGDYKLYDNTRVTLHVINPKFEIHNELYVGAWDNDNKITPEIYEKFYKEMGKSTDLKP